MKGTGVKSADVRAYLRERRQTRLRADRFAGMADGIEQLRATIGEDGWICARDGDGPLVYIQTERVEEGGKLVRLLPRRVLIEGDPEVTPDRPRSIKPTRTVARPHGPGLPLTERLPDSGQQWGPPVAPPTDEDVVHWNWRSHGLQRPDNDQRSPEEFYREVARQYQAAVRVTSKPAALLAEPAGVPVTTVHRWVREARRRGFLPTGRKGKAG